MIDLENSILKIKEDVISFRRELHKIPELGFEEYKTSTFIAAKLKEFGIKAINVAKTGIVGFLEGSQGDRTLAFRADMDALSVEEKTGLEFTSTHEGRMHACGHDGHMAILLGLAKYLSLNKDKLHYNVVFIFQPAEEGPGGADPIIKEGVLRKYNVEKIYGLHLYPAVEEGRIGCRPGPLMAQCAEFDIVVKGQSGHGAIPNKAVDSIVVCANLISSYQSIISRNIDPIEGAVLTIGKMWSGERRNIIAGEGNLEGTIRAFNEEIYNKIKCRMVEIAKGLELMYNCSIEIIFRDLYPAVINNKEMYHELVEAIGMDNIDEMKPQMTAEDFSYYQKEVPGLFFFLGVRNEQKGYTYPLHHCLFDYDEDNLIRGIQVYVELLRHLKGLEK